jgi:hypothetical protein
MTCTQCNQPMSDARAVWHVLCEACEAIVRLTAEVDRSHSAIVSLTAEVARLKGGKAVRTCPCGHTVEKSARGRSASRRMRTPPTAPRGRSAHESDPRPLRVHHHGSNRSGRRRGGCVGDVMRLVILCGTCKFHDRGKCPFLTVPVKYNDKACSGWEKRPSRKPRRK